MATGQQRSGRCSPAAITPSLSASPERKGRDMTHIVAIITAKSGWREAILPEFRANMPAVHAEKGCIEYGPAIDAEGIGSFQTKFGPAAFAGIEKWESPEALGAQATP